MLDMYNTQDQLEYDRLANAYGLNAQAAALQYDQEYNNYWQTQNFNEDSRRWAAEMGLKSQQYNDAKEQWQKEYDLDLLKATGGDGSVNGNNYLKLDDKLYQTALGNYNKWGGAKNSNFRKWFDSLNISHEDAELLLDYVLAKGDQLSLTEDKNNIFKADDNTYVDQWGYKYTKQELLDLGYSEEQIKAMKKK